ncbi:glycosyltransferase family 4 protein [Oceanobacillus sp. FSL K6-2867]|uniref:glycosyltransferase family 4 protein n=1 Tax=Oceanobacillus sp. FSL K6-2867 TaxID=2954748 RepID=UPI0030D7246B
MKVTHLTSVHKYNDTRIFLKECTTIAKHDYEVSLVAPQAIEGVYNNVNVYSLNLIYKNRIERFFKSTKLIVEKAMEIDSDIYHFHDPELIPVGIELKKRGKRIIYDIHEDVPRQILNKHWIPGPLRKIISFLFEKYEDSMVKKFDAIIAATPHIEQRFKKNNNLVVNVSNYPIQEELISSRNQMKKENTVVYIGGITEERGSITMLNAINKTSGALNLAGKIINSEEEYKLKSHSVWQAKVNYLGFLDRNQIKSILATSKAGLVVLEPRLNFIDSLPIKMFEYMSAGIPVIASNFPLWKEIIEGNNCGICVDPFNVDEIATAIQWVLDNPDEAEKMGENGRNAVERKYNWETESKKLIKVYSSLVYKGNMEE